MEALEFIEEDYSQLLETENNKILDESYICLNEEYNQFYKQVRQFTKDMGKYRIDYKKAVKDKDKNKINNVIKNMRKTIKETRKLIEDSDTDVIEFLISWFTGGFVSSLRMFVPTFVYAAAVYGVNISPVTGKIDKSGKATAIGYMVGNMIPYVNYLTLGIRSIINLISDIKTFINRLNKGDIIGAFTYNKRAMLQYLDEFDKIVSKLEVKSEKDLEPKK